MAGGGIRARLLIVVTLVLLVTTTPLKTVAATGNVAGSITLYGCVPNPDDLAVAANDIQNREAGEQPPRELRGSVFSTEEENVFGFEFQGLSTDAVYEIGALLPDDACGRIVWESVGGRLALPGTTPPLTLRGYAIRSRLEIRNERSDDPATEWLGADIAAPSVGNRRTFRWFTDHRALMGELQFSLEPFRPEDPCARSPSVIYRESVPAQPGSWVDVEVDMGFVFGNVPEERRKFVERGAGIFARVVPVIMANDVRECDLVDLGASGTATISFVPPELVDPAPLPIPTLEYGRPTAADAIRFGAAFVNDEPDENEVCYQTTVVHAVNLNHNQGPVGVGDLIAKGDGYSDGDVLIPGTILCNYWVHYSGGGGGFLDSISDFVTGVVDSVSWFVNKLADMYNDIKLFVVQRVVDALDWVGQEIVHYDFCQSECEQLVQYAVEYGMAMMGLPPSLPNFDQLTELGVDYVKMQVAEQTGVPQEVIDYAAEIAAKSAQNMRETRGGSTTYGSWFPWAVDYTGLHPAAILLKVRHLNLAVPSPEALYIPTSGNLFHDAYVPLRGPLPRAVPPEPFLTIPVVLTPNVEAVPPMHLTGSGFVAPPFHNRLFNVRYDLLLALESLNCTLSGQGTRVSVHAGHWLNPSVLQLDYVDADWMLDPTEPAAFFGPVHTECSQVFP